MYKIAKIIFKPISENQENILDRMDSILSMLYKNGQILESWTVEKHYDFYTANVVTTDDDSLDVQYYNKYIIEAIKEFDVEIEIVCDDAMASDCCHCRDHKYFVFAVDPNFNSSPVICGNCGKEIPLIRIPYLYDEEEHYTILNFQKMYQAVDNLWINSLSDRFTKRQIVDHNSQLNRIGMEIRFELEKKLNKPVFYLLCNPIGGWFEFEKNNKNLESCPKCGGDFSTIQNSYADRVCHTCKLAFMTHRDGE